MRFLDAVRDKVMGLHGMEKGLCEGLATLHDRAQDPGLRAALLEHQARAKRQARRLETVCERMGWTPDGAVPKALQGVQWGVREALVGRPAGPLTDVLIVAQAQTIAHLEIAGYGTARAWAHRLGYDDMGALLAKSLEEEKAFDRQLTELAETGLNQSATVEIRHGTRR